VLIIIRKRGESILIGDNIKIVVHSISGKYVKIGIDAPKDVSIQREELLTKKKKETTND